jgi:hypothetical protein
MILNSLILSQAGTGGPQPKSKFEVTDTFFSYDIASSHVHKYIKCFEVFRYSVDITSQPMYANNCTVR